MVFVRREKCQREICRAPTPSVFHRAQSKSDYSHRKRALFFLRNFRNLRNNKTQYPFHLACRKFLFLVALPPPLFFATSQKQPMEPSRLFPRQFQKEKKIPLHS